LRDRGEAPPGVDAPQIYATIRSGEYIAPGSDWNVVYQEALRTVVRPLEQRQAAE